jgi:hypothetical protein
MVISRIEDKLKKYPDVVYTTRQGYLEVPAQSPTGFSVSISEDDGQSPLQVAFKTGNFTIANLLLDRGPMSTSWSHLTSMSGPCGSLMRIGRPQLQKAEPIQRTRNKDARR